MKKGLVFLAFERKAIATTTKAQQHCLPLQLPLPRQVQLPSRFCLATIATIESLGCSLQIILATLPLLPLKVLVPSLQIYLATLPLCCLL